MTSKTFFILILVMAITFQASAVLGADETAAKQAYLDADKKISEMQKEGYPTLPLLDSLNEAEIKYNLNDYNASYTLSINTISDADKIILLQEELLRLTDDLKTLNTLGLDTAALDISLLYAKSDFESANIGIALEEADKLDKEIYPVLSNYSKKYYDELKNYSKSLEEPAALSNFFKEYLRQQEEYYINADYSAFLKGFLKFESLKKIISIQAELEKNIVLLEGKNISFNRLNDSMALFETQVNLSDFENAEKTLSELNSLSKTALSLKLEMDNLTVYYEKISSMGILDNKTAALFELAKKEFSLENYIEAEKKSDETKKALLSLETNNIIFGGLKKASIKKGLKDFFVNNWLTLLIIFVILTLAYKPVKIYLFLKYSVYQRKKLSDEKEAIELLQTELQKEYYIERFIDKKTYKSDFTQYEERKAEIQSRFIFLEEKSKTYSNYLDKIKRITRIFGKKQDKT
jgi:hypothetical protein